MFKKLFAVAFMTFVATNVNWAYTEINCSSDQSFSQYACNQCFDGWEVAVWSNISFLDDVWVNDTGIRKIMFKEEQTMPIMHSLNNSKLTKNPNTDAFWEYTAEFEALEDNEFYGYVLPAGQRVSWLKSSLWASYLVEQTPAKWQNVWMLVFDVMSHNILADGEIAMNDTPHKECVLYKSGESYVPPVAERPTPEPTPEPEKMTQVQTGPELYFLVLIMSFLMGIIVMNRKTILEKIRK